MNNINQKLIDDLSGTIRFLQYFNYVCENDTEIESMLLKKSNVTSKTLIIRFFLSHRH